MGALCNAMDQSVLLRKSGGNFQKRQPIKLQSSRSSVPEVTDSQIEESSDLDSKLSETPPSPSVPPRVASKPLPLPPSKNVSPRTSAADEASKIAQFAVVTGSPMLNNKRHALILKPIQVEQDTDTDSPSGNDSSLSPERNEDSALESQSSKKWVSGKKNSPLPSPTVSPRIGVSTSRISQTATAQVSPRTSSGNGSGNSNHAAELATMTPPFARARAFDVLDKSSNPALQRSKHGLEKVNKDVQFHLAVKRGDLVKATALLKDGAQINSLDKDGQSALDFAYMTRQSGLAQFLIAQGATPKEGAIPAIVQSASPQKSLEKPAITLDSVKSGYYDPGIDASSDSPSHSPLSSPKQDEDAEKRIALLNRDLHAILAKSDIMPHDFKQLDALLLSGAQINSLNSSLQPALVQEISKQYPSLNVFEYLIKKGANVNMQGQRSGANGKGMVAGPTALQEASRKGLWRYIQILLAAKADPNIEDGNGSTPLLSAVYAQGRTQRGEEMSVLISHMLIKAGANVMHKNSRGATAYDTARSMHNKHELAEYLERKQEELLHASSIEQSVMETPQASVVEDQ